MPDKDFQDQEGVAVGPGEGAGASMTPLIKERREHLLAKGHSPHSMNTVSSDIMKLANWMQDNGLTSLSQLGPKRMERFCVWLSNAKGQAPGKAEKALSLASRHRILSNLRSFLRWCHVSGHCPSDLSRHLDLPRLPKPLPREIPPLKDIANLIRTQRRKGTPLAIRNAAIISILFACGLRCRECVGLTLADVNLNDREIRVGEGKGGRGRVVPIAMWGAEVVRQYLDEARPVLVGTENNDALFVRVTGRAISSKDIFSVMRDASEDAKLATAIHAHDLRHAFCLNLLKGGASIRVVNALAGHRRLTMTARYTRLTAGDLKNVIRKTHPRGRRRP